MLQRVLVLWHSVRKQRYVKVIKGSTEPWKSHYFKKCIFFAKFVLINLAHSSISRKRLHKSLECGKYHVLRIFLIIFLASITYPLTMLLKYTSCELHFIHRADVF